VLRSTLGARLPSAVNEPARERGTRQSVLRLFTSRAVLALSGFGMLGFVVLHLGGNLLALAGSEPFNAYARSLRALGTPVIGEGVVLWAARVALAGAFVAHLVAHVAQSRQPTSYPAAATAGRWAPLPAAYTPHPPAYAAYPLPILRVSGGAIMLFLAFHLAQLTFGAGNAGFVPGDPYRTMVASLKSWPVALIYVGAAGAVAAHVLPGTWTGMRSLGLIQPRTERLARVLAPTIALTVFLGLAATPVTTALGLIG
jgi:succinate dehydrogenase / fumarate reductase, cytochrome b subunit